MSSHIVQLRQPFGVSASLTPVGIKAAPRPIPKARSPLGAAAGIDTFVGMSHAKARACGVGITRASSGTGPNWHIVLADRAEALGIKSISTVEAAARMATDDWVLVDVRPADFFAKGHPEGAVNIPLFDKPQSLSLFNVLRCLLLKSQNVPTFGFNPDFVDQLQAVAGERGVIFACDSGGTMEPSINFDKGKRSRSLMALHIAMERSGLSRLTHLQGGIERWHAARMPFVGTFESQAFRGGAGVDPPKGKYEDGRWRDDS